MLRGAARNITHTAPIVYIALFAAFFAVNFSVEALSTPRRLWAHDLSGILLLSSALAIISVALRSTDVIRRFAAAAFVAGVVESVLQCTTHGGSSLFPSRHVDTFAQVAANRTFVVACLCAAEQFLVDFLLSEIFGFHGHRGRA